MENIILNKKRERRMGKNRHDFFWGMLANAILGPFVYALLFNVFGMIFSSFMLNAFIWSIAVFIILEGVMITYLWKKQRRFALGMITGIMIPLLIFGSCVLVLRNALG